MQIERIPVFIFAPIGVVCLVREFWINTTRSLYISDVLPAYAVLTALARPT